MRGDVVLSLVLVFARWIQYRGLGAVIMRQSEARPANPELGTCLRVLAWSGSMERDIIGHPVLKLASNFASESPVLQVRMEDA